MIAWWFVALIAFGLSGCWWHESIDDNRDIPISCIVHSWREAEVVIEELLPNDGDADGNCVPLGVGDRFLVTATPACAAGLLTGKPTPDFVAAIAPYCGLEEGPAFICRAEVTDGEPYDGPVISVEMIAETLIVDWNAPAQGGSPAVSCRQRFRVSLASAVPR